jgi:hypothetical protein
MQLESPNTLEQAKMIMSITGGVATKEICDKLNLPRATLYDRIQKSKKIISQFGEDYKIDARGLFKGSPPLTHSNKKRIVYFTDAHNQPKLSMDRFKWLARYINDQKPDYIVDGGDFDDFESLCSHVRDDTHKGKLKDPLQKDLEYSWKARKLLADLIKVDCPKYITLGNHEQRIWDYENCNPAMMGIASGMYLAILNQFGWEVTPFKQYLDIEGVEFTHVPMNGMNRPLGGKRVTVNVAVCSIKDVCFGHTHVLGQHTEPKLGNGRGVTAFNGGAYMPHGYIPDYASWSQKQPWYGVHTITVADGKIQSISSISILDLEYLYG